MDDLCKANVICCDDNCKRCANLIYGRYMTQKEKLNTMTVGDIVITSRGEVGIITDICNCDKCTERGFHEPMIEPIVGEYITCTDLDSQRCFRSFYRIGNQIYGNLDKDSLLDEIHCCEQQIQEKQEHLSELNKQYKVIELLEELKNG